MSSDAEDVFEAEAEGDVIPTRDHETATEVGDVDWGDVWAIANAEPSEPLSHTQASLCVQVSDQTAHNSDETARAFVLTAIDEGHLKPVSDAFRADIFVIGGGR